jgi:hypothetical protein
MSRSFIHQTRFLFPALAALAFGVSVPSATSQDGGPAPVIDDSTNRLPTPAGSTGTDWVRGTINFPTNAGEDAIDWVTGVNVDIGGVLFPHLHTWGVFGGSTTDPSKLAVSHHDPQANATLTGFEPGMSLRAGMLQGYVGGVGVTDADGDFTFELEEGFLKVIDLPFGMQLRGGQYFNRFGFQNSVHNHGWLFADQNLVNGRFLNEGEMITQGGEVTWLLPIDFMRVSMFSASVGGVRTHGHHHHHGHGHGNGDEDHDDHDDHAEPAFEGEGAAFQDFLVTAAWVNQYDFNDNNRVTGILSGAWGENAFGRNTQVYGLGLEYLWRENGYAMGGNSFRWRTEMMIRSTDAVSGHLPGEGHDDHDDHDDDDHDDDDDDDDHGDERRPANFTDFGINTMLVFGFNDRVETGVRAEWVSGVSEMGLDNRVRLSPMVTWYANAARTLTTRLQYNWDHSNDFGNEHSVWFQVGYNWGGAEVR